MRLITHLNCVEKLKNRPVDGGDTAASARKPAWDFFLKRVGAICLVDATLPAGPMGRFCRDGTCRAPIGFDAAALHTAGQRQNQ
ncbi:hypothetical protein QF000_002240 [Paraburkholderia atlantica]|uniref:Uncharacterized protein n=1 Tax=Paraburkholderia atlantica TaxID=2654982 RepID=A0A7W8V2M5_PARAM|nr:hypothetical protein [Paraburkholderia atlantica]MBB5420520.1 hypothetical protein [Paraburkholderia atlantica]MBB5422688.1 hypothetical protein [Paraburkholderia atlantica]